MATVSDIQNLYIAYFNRPADVAGLNYWTTGAQAAFTPVQIAQSFSVQPEYAAAFAGFTTTQTVNALYVNLFNHSADPAGLAYWVGQVNNGTFTIGQVAIGILAGATGADAAAVAAKVAAANAFTTAMSTNTQAQVGYNPSNGSYGTAKAWLGTVVDAASGTAAATLAATINNIATNGGVGQVLTANTDNLTGNLFTAGLVYTPGNNNRLNALQDEDVLTGTGTNPTLNATVGNANNDGGTTITPTLKGVNTVNVNFTGSSTVSAGVGNNAVNTLSFQRTTGATAINVLGVTNNTGTVTLLNIAEATTNNLSLASMLGGNVQNAVFHYQTGVLAKGGFTANLGLNNVNIGTAQLSNAPVVAIGNEGFSTLNLSSGVAIPNQANAASTAQNSLQTLIVPTLSTLNINGSANLSILTTTNGGVAGSRPVNFFPNAIINNGTALTTVNASTFTGNLTIDLSGYTNVQTTNVSSGAPVYLNFTGGTGNDTVFVGTATDTTLSKATIDGGTGTNTLKLFNNFAPSGATTGIVVKNIQNLTVTPQNDTAGSPAAVTVDTSAVGAALVRVDVRNEDAGGINQAITLTNISTALAAPATAAAAAGGPGLYLHHSTTGESGILNNNVTLNLAATGAGASEAVNIVTDLNTDVRSNYTLTTRGSDGVAVGNLTINDLGVESHNINVTSVPATSLTVKGGTAGTFINLDAISHGGIVVGGYQLDASGSTALNGAVPQDTVVTAAANVDTNLGGIPTQYQVLGASVAGDRRFSTTKIDSTGSLSDFIVRVGGQGSTNLAQSITLGNATNTVIFDAQNNINAGLSSIVSVTGGTGLDTIALNGNLTAGGVTPSGTITLGVSEWQNVKGIDVIRLIENGVAGVQNVANLYSAGTNQPGVGTGAIQNAATAGGYNLTITNALVGQADAGKTFTIVNNDGLVNVGPESQAVIDASQLATNTPFKFIGANKNFGVLHNSNNIILSDASFSKNAVLAGGNVNANAAVTTTVANNNSLTILNTAQVTFDDLANKSDFATIYVKNNVSTAQTATIQLNGAIIDALVDSAHKAATSAAVPTANVETLTIVALDNIQSLATAPGFNNPNITTSNVVIDASSILGTAGAGAFGLNVVLGRGASVGGVAANQVTGTGTVNDTIVELGNYAPSTYNAAINLPSSTSNNGSVAGQAAISVASQANNVTVGQRVVTDTINDANATLTTYGAIDLTGVNSLSGNAALIGTLGVAKLVANSDITLTVTEFAALTSITFSGTANHTLRIIGQTAANTAAINLALSKIIFLAQGNNTLTIDTSTVTYGAGSGTFNGQVGLNGAGSWSLGTVAANFNSGVAQGNNTGVSPSNVIYLTAGGVFNGVANLNENFTGNAAALVGTTVNGNGTDTDFITFTGGGTFNIGSGNTITNIKTVSTDNTSTDVFFNVATSGVTTINGGTGNDRVFLANSGSSMLAGNVNLGAGNNTLTMEGKTYTGTFTAGTGTADTLSLVDSSNIAAANITGFENLVVASNAGITLTTSQYAAFTSINATGTNTFTFTDAGTVVGNTTVENYILANGTNTFTAAAGLVSVTGGTGADTFNIGDAIITATVAANGINGGAGTDTLNVGAVTAALDMSTKVTGIETINVTGGTNPAWTVTNENGAGVILNFTKSAATAINNVTLGSGGQTLNILGTGTGATTITGGSGVDIINLSTTATGADVIAAGSNINAIDTINNFKAAGADSFSTGVFATSLLGLTIANADTGSLAAAISAAASSVGASLATTGQAYIIVVNSGTAAGTYAFQNTGSNPAAVDTGDFIVKLGGTTGLIVTTDFGIANAVAVTPGGTFNGTLGTNDIFMSSIPGLNGTTIAGNAADTDVLTLTTAGTVTLNNGSTGGTISNIKVLNLANGTNTITYNNSAGFTTINGGTGDDTFIPNTALFPIVVNGGSGTDTIVLPATYAAVSSGSGTFANNVTNFEKLRLTGVTNQTIDMQVLGNYNDVTFSGANGLTLLNMPSNSNITLTGAGTAFTVSNAAFVGGVNDILNVSLNDNSGAGVSFASVGITASGVETSHITVNDNQGSPTGAFNDALAWLGNSVKTITVSGNAGLTLTANSTALTTVDASGITLGGFTWTSNALTGAATITGTTSGNNTVNFNSATVASSYTGGTGNDNVAANGTLAHTVALGSGTNSLTLTGSAILGSYTSGAGTNDTLTLTSATPDISAATVTGFENLNLASNAILTATAAEVAQFATGNITAAGTETINLTTAGTFSALSNVENYNLANGTNNFTSADVAVSVIGGTGADTFNFTANQMVNFLTTIDGGSGFDTLNIGATTTQNIDISTKVNSVETVNVSGSTGTASFTMANGAGYLLNYIKSTGANTINLGSGGQTLNLTGGTNAATTITGGAAVDTISLQSSGGASETLIETGANMSNKTQIDKVANFSATGVDFFKTGVNASTVGSFIIGNADTGNYLSTIASGLSLVLNNTGQAYLITIQTGTAAGTYLFQNTGSDTANFDNTDFFVQLTGAFGSISTANMIA